jgi:predicted dehydrogenase
MSSLNRRNLLKTAALAPVFVPRSAWGANDRLAYGAIGTGSRGRYLNTAFQKLGARCVGLCDVYEPHLRLARQGSPPGAKAFVDYNDLLAMKGLDFVMIAAADHHHRPALLAALAAGMDAYLEKPLSVSLEESALMIDAVKKTNRVVQVGMQRRSTQFVRDARQFIQEGGLGAISLVEARWNWHFELPLDNSPLPGELDWERFLGPAPKRPLEPRRFRWWRAFWDYCGGNMTDQGTHLMDVVQWMTNSGPPLSATCQGAVIHAEGSEVPNVFSAAFEYPGFLATWTLDYRSAFDFDWSITFRGEKATMVMNRNGYALYTEPPSSEAPWAQNFPTKPAKQVADRFETDPHLQNFLDCVRSRQTPNCPVDVAAAGVAGPHLANLAYRQGRKVRMDASGRVA